MEFLVRERYDTVDRARSVAVALLWSAILMVGLAAFMFALEIWIGVGEATPPFSLLVGALLFLILGLDARQSYWRLLDGEEDPVTG